jgi:transglutaminase-like putative cysteine protease
MKHMKYGDSKGGGALNALRSGQGQCGCFANLLVASLRNIGIPARSVFGFWEGKTAWHVWTEFYIPGPGWIPADPSHGKVNYEHSSEYAVAFGTMPDLNKRCVVAVGHDHQLGSRKVDHLHQPAHFWSGTAKFLRWESQTDLQPDKPHTSSK